MKNIFLKKEKKTKTAKLTKRNESARRKRKQRKKKKERDREMGEVIDTWNLLEDKEKWRGEKNLTSKAEDWKADLNEIKTEWRMRGKWNDGEVERWWSGGEDSGED